MTSTPAVVVLNPNSGRRDSADEVRRRAAEADREFHVRETREAGDAVAFAREAAADGAPLVVAAGGDGTVNEVARGIDEAAAFDRTTLGVVPVGTGNNFAGNIGVPDIETAFEVLDAGERRRIDLGRANGRLFVNSCVAGLTAEASADTSADMKGRMGTLAYVANTIREAASFEGLRLTVSVRDGDGAETPAWSGDAQTILVGNGRRFTTHGGDQANMEDGRFDVLIIEDASNLTLAEEELSERLFGREADHAVRLQAPGLDVTVETPETVSFSLDGEIESFRELSVDVRPKVLEVAVGDGYRPDPDVEP